ncbi:MAG: hypothetical protein LLF94_11805 [Chlamydiales bacterium]|nr:hypothetical protein [Chlamydiales bacterium]
MSGGIVDVIGGTAVFALATGVLAYSCGPNVVVGGLGLLGRGARKAMAPEVIAASALLKESVLSAVR